MHMHTLQRHTMQPASFYPAVNFYKQMLDEQGHINELEDIEEYEK